MQIWENTNVYVSLEAASSSRIWGFNTWIDCEESLFFIPVKLLSFILHIFSIYLNILRLNSCFSTYHFKHFGWSICVAHNFPKEILPYFIIFRTAVSLKGGKLILGTVVQLYCTAHVCGMYGSNIYQCIINVHWNSNNNANTYWTLTPMCQTMHSTVLWSKAYYC